MVLEPRLLPTMLFSYWLDKMRLADDVSTVAKQLLLWAGLSGSVLCSSKTSIIIIIYLYREFAPQKAKTVKATLGIEATRKKYWKIKIT